MGRSVTSASWALAAGFIAGVFLFCGAAGMTSASTNPATASYCCTPTKPNDTLAKVSVAVVALAAIGMLVGYSRPEIGQATSPAAPCEIKTTPLYCLRC